MTWLIVAKKDFRDAIQSRALWGLVALFVLLSVFSAYAYIQVPSMFGSPGGATFSGLLLFSVGLVGLFLPLAAIVVCYKSLAGERELGSIKLLLSFPTTRGNVFAGKVVGRAAVLSFALGIGLLVGLGFGAALLGSIDVRSMLLFLLVTFVFAITYTVIMVGLSATTGSTSRAITLAIGFFALFELFWDVVPMAILYVVEGFQLPTRMPDWLFPVMQLSPSSAYASALLALIPGLSGDGAQAGVNVGATASSGDPFYLSPEIGLLVLAVWIVVPLLVGYRQFTTADI